MPGDLESTGGEAQRRSSSPQISPYSPRQILGNIIRPTRLRGNVIIGLIFSIFLLASLAAKGHTSEIQGYVLASLPTSKPGNPYLDRSEVVNPEEIELYSQFNSTAASTSQSHPRPKFHLLIPTAESSTSLCRTLVSSAVLGYPPPTLIGYEAKQPKNNIESILRWLHTKEAGDDDLVLVADTHTWFQLPAQVLVDRFSTFLQQSDAHLLEQYGTQAKKPGAMERPTYLSRVVFPATKRCELRNNGTEEGDPISLCNAVPRSTLPNDIFGENTDELVDSKEVRPRFLSGYMHIGSVRDLRTLYTAAYDALETGESSPGTIFSTLYAAQSIARAKVMNEGLSFFGKLRSELSPARQAAFVDLLEGHTPNIDMEAAGNYGIALDHRSDIFQSMALSADDIRPLSFNKPILVASPSRLAAQSFVVPLQLPADLNSSRPFSLLPIPTVGEVSNDPWLELDRLPLHKTWRDIPLLTNIFVPWSSVPASLNLNPAPKGPHESANATLAGLSVEQVEAVMWPHTWFASHARALMRRYLRSPTGHVGAVEADNGGANWWDLRGGVGGVWTDGAVFLEWNEVCGAHDMEVFGDGLGELGKEEGKGMGTQGKKIDKWGEAFEEKRAVKKEDVEETGSEDPVDEEVPEDEA